MKKVFVLGGAIALSPPPWIRPCISENNPTTNYLQLEEKSNLLSIFSKRKKVCWVGKKTLNKLQQNE